MRERILLVLRGLGSLAALVLLLAGPPAALVRFVGNPLPAEVPDLAGIGDALTRTGIDDRTVIKILALLAWFVWIQIAAAVLAEITGQIRSLPAPSLPIVPGFQPIARQLVAGVVLISALSGPGRTGAPAAAATPPPVTAIVEEEPTPSAAPSRPVATMESAAPVAPASPATSEYIVQRHDSLWSIAEDLLGDGYRWREIRDLNLGKVQPDGGALTATSDVIHPGWTLTVPSSTAAPSPSGPIPKTHSVERGEHLWDIAEETLETALGRAATHAEIDPYWREVVEHNRADLPDPSNPDLLFAGNTVRLPPVPGTETEAPAEQPPAPSASPPEAEPLPASPSPAPAPARPVPPTSPPTSTPSDTPEPLGETDADAAEFEDGTESEIGIAVGVLGVAGTGVAAVIALKLARRRRDRQARAAPGHVVPATPDDLLDTHREVAARADLDQYADVRAALAEVARHVAGRRRARCRPRLVQVDRYRIDVLLEEPDVNPPTGWMVEASGEVWATPRGQSADSESSCVAPLLATLGRPDGNTELLYDLEAAGSTTLTGDADTALRLVRSILREIVHQPDEVAVVTVGDLPVPDDPRVRTAAAWDEIADDVLTWARQSARALQAHKLDSAFIARGSGRSIDGTIPMLLVVDSVPDDERFEELLGLAHRGAAVAILVISGDRTVGTSVLLADERLTVPSLGLELEAQGIDEEAADDIDELVEAADRPATAKEPEPNGHALSSKMHASPNREPYTDPDFDVLVRLLGQIEAEGGREPLKPKQLGLLTYIATHPGCSAEQVEEALWPDPIATRRHRLHITLSQIRSAIGPQHLPPFEDEGSYRVADSVRTDLDLFERRIQYADGKPALEAIPILRGSLELVTGAPFSYNSRGRGSFAWVDTEHWMSTTEASVVKAAWDLWQLYTDNDDSDGAIWAAQRGLLASPTNTELTNCLLRAYATRGDQGAAERVYRSHVRALDRLDLGEPEDSTVELWDELAEHAHGQT
jgi:nucleoid-associated protein YgaU/DNA-binding SARP family transcriptional activator